MENARYKVLLIEDNQIEQRMFQRFVETNAIPYDCTIAESVSEAQRILTGQTFDIVISDHDLGDGTAFDVLELTGETPIIVVTGAGDEETAVKAWKAGAYDYLIKDVDQNYLKAIPITVENAIHHKMVEKKLQLLSGAVMSTEDSVYITDMKGTIVFVNKAFCRTYGYTEEEILGQNSSLLWIQKAQGENTRSVFQTRSFSSGWEVGFYHRRKDESIFPVSLSRSTIKDAHRHDVAIVGVARDISERILIEDELRTTSLKFKKRYQRHNCFAILVAETLQKLLAGGNIDRAATVIQDYLDLSKVSADKLELRRSQFNFAVLADQVLEALASRAAGKNIELRSFKPDVELMVHADYDRMAQTLNNLIHRAVICSPVNSGVELHIKDGDHELVVEIYDSGPPHGPDQIHTMVNNPEWLREQFQAGREDTALGLRIAKELVEMHGGRIWTEYAKTRRANMICFAVPKVAARRELAVASDATTIS